MTDALFVIAGFFLLIEGADYLVSGSSALARRLGVSGLVGGLTVVALGTSMPEFVVNLFAAVQKTGDIAIGNILGSNMANIGLVLGLSAALFPMRVSSSTIWKEIPFSLLAVVLVYVMASDVLFDGARADILGRTDGLALLAFFIIFIYYVLGMASASRSTEEVETERMRPARMGLFIAGGIAALVIGGKFVVDGATGIATGLGLSTKLIGLTVVALGTSLPELVTSIVAAFRRQADISVGNIVGSNILNIFFVLGTSAAIRPLSFSASAVVDALAAVFFTALLFVFMFLGKRHELERWQGIGFVLLYLAYMGYAIIQG